MWDCRISGIRDERRRVGSGGTTLARTTVLNSSNSGALVNFSSGSQFVWCDLPASLAVIKDQNSNVSIAGSFNSINTFGFKNRLIDAGFIINQNVYVSNTALASGVYGHDQWKAGSSGCTYTFTQGSLGVPIVITITAGSLQQVIEGCNMPEGGTYVLSWTGTAQARVNGGTYGSSPLTVTGITAGANTTIEFNTGTLSFPQLEVGSSRTGYEYRQYQQELALCLRYFEILGIGCGGTARGNTFCSAIRYAVPKRATPTIKVLNTTLAFSNGSGTATTLTGATLGGAAASSALGVCQDIYGTFSTVPSVGQSLVLLTDNAISVSSQL